MDKRTWIWLTAACIVLVGCLGSCFFIYSADREGKLDRLQQELADAHQTIWTLEQENLQLEQDIEAAEAFAEAENGPTIPFEVDLDAWNYLLVNTWEPLEKDFEIDLAKVQNGQQVDRRIKKDLEQMLADAKKEGLRMLICSSYRDYKKQEQLLDQSIRSNMKKGLDYTEAFFKARERTAAPGESEHHTGLAVDIVSTKYQSLDERQANTKEARWLYEHAAEYGFILRYPKNKEELTGILFESWHFRYVGREAAQFMKEYDLCLEEFLELARLQQEQKKGDGGLV